MQNTHTPGPWETSRDAVPDGHVQITIYEEATGKRVATAFEAEANARLIASAPALLAALEGALVSMSCGACDRSVPCKRCEAALDNARAAIEAARA